MSCTEISYNGTEIRASITDEITLTLNNFVPTGQLLEEKFPDISPKYTISMQLTAQNLLINLVTNHWEKLYRVGIELTIDGQNQTLSNLGNNTWSYNFRTTYKNPICLVVWCEVCYRNTLIKDDTTKELHFWDEEAPTLVKDIAGLLDGDGDVLLSAQDEKIQAHRLVLSARSPVFRAMLFGQTSESQTRVVKIQDLAAETVRGLVEFAYTDTLPQQVPPELILAADKYDMPRLRNMAIQHLLREDNFLPSIIIDFYIIAHCLSWPELQLQIVSQTSPDTIPLVQASTSWTKTPDDIKIAFLDNCLSYNLKKSN